jgi:TetR/AcrR family tetracycline transcriptional repressor
MSFDKSEIVEVALDLLDEVGLEGLSTRRLATKLGISSPSLYWYFHSKQELIDHMAEALLRTALPPPDLDGSGFDWESWLVKALAEFVEWPCRAVMAVSCSWRLNRPARTMQKV